MMQELCRICKNKTSVIGHPKFGSYHLCGFCEFISKDANDILDPEDELKIYENHNNSIDDPRYVEYFKKFIDACVIDFIVKEAKGLDFGSGPSPVLSRILQRDYGIKMDIYDPFYSPQKVYDGKKYDLITSTEVLEHLDDPLSYFRLFRTLLNEKGILAVKTAFHPGCAQRFLDWYYIRDKTHISFYTRKTFADIASVTGMDIIYSDGLEYVVFAFTV